MQIPLLPRLAKCKPIEYGENSPFSSETSVAAVGDGTGFIAKIRLIPP